MASAKYHRLGALVVDYGTGVMKELLIHCAKTEPGLTFTDLKTYLLTPTIKKAIHRLNGVRGDQLRNLYPKSGGVEESALDVSLCSTLLIEMFKNTVVRGDVRKALTTIRKDRNTLLHKKATADVSDSEFNTMWMSLKTSIMTLAKTAKGPAYEQETADKIDDLMTNNLPGLSNSWMEWTRAEMSDVRGDIEGISVQLQNMAQASQSGRQIGAVSLIFIKAVRLEKQGRENKPCYRSLVFLPCGRLAAVDVRNSHLVIYDQYLVACGAGYRFDSRMSCVNVLGDNKLVVAGPNTLHILRFDVQGSVANLSLIKELSTSHSYSSLTTISKGHFVGCTKAARSSLATLDVTETSVCENIITKCDSISIFAYILFIWNSIKLKRSEKIGTPYNVSYRASDDSLMYTTFRGASLRIYSRRSKKNRKVKYEDSVLKKPAGSCPGPDDSWFVCSWGTDSLVHISKTGDVVECHKLVQKPFAVTINAAMDMLAVSSKCLGTNELQLYSLK